MESFFEKIDLLLEELVEVELLHPDCQGVTVVRRGQDGFVVYSWTEFTVHEPSAAGSEFREHLLPTGGWTISPYTARTAREALQRRLASLKELNIEL